MDTPDARCALVAAEQHGCITLAQALTCGLSPQTVRRRVAQKRWWRLHPKVFAIRGAPSSWEQKLWAAVLWADGSVVSGLAAGALWGFPGVDPGPVEISHPTSRHRPRGIVLHCAEVDGDGTTVRALPVTTPSRTVADVAGRMAPSRLDVVVHHCLHRRLTTLGDLERRVQGSQRGCPGATRLRKVLAAYAGDPTPVGSPLEAALDRRLRASSLPPPRRQHPVVVGGRCRFFDFAWPAVRVGIEVDGYRWHSSRSAWENDRVRLSDLRRAGWTIVNVTYDDVHHGVGGLLDELKALLPAESSA